MSVDLEELARRARGVEPVWDDLREQRVLDSIRKAPPAAPDAPPRRVPIVAAVAAALLLAGAGLWAWWPTAPVAEGPRAPEAPSVAAPDPPGEPSERSEMVLADGSTVALDADARVRLAEQGAERVVLEQERGRATYTVARAPSHSFEVHTPAAIVRVRGTVFVVDVGVEATEVEVREGRVEVEARAEDGRLSLLGAGDAISVAVRRAEAEPAVEPQRPRSASGPPSPAERAPESPPPSPSSASESADALLERADDARLAGDSPEAARSQERFLDRYASDGRAASAAFTLGRVESRRGRHRDAARAFELCRRLAPAGPLAEDALAQEALAWSAAGDATRARLAADRYVAAHPEGLHRSRLQRLQGDP